MEGDLKVYDEKTGEVLEGPFDYSKGKLYKGTRFVGHQEAQEEISHKELMPGTEHMNGGNGLYTTVIDQPAKEAEDMYEECYFWHTFTDEDFSSGTSTSIDTERIMNTINEKVSSAIVTAVALSKGG